MGLSNLLLSSGRDGQFAYDALRALDRSVASVLGSASQNTDRVKSDPPPIHHDNT
jgi:hypothetical protein